ncbi:MAG: enoyl-CoA hydratase/isomerase family protein [Acidobacteria bacterium]|nr:enoyl-CoA hydratase/isomerase family protein [Acidobacteriota bacterium]
MTEYELIKYDVDDPIATITLNRPEQLNAITGSMMAEMKHAMAAAEQDERVVGIVLTGAGRGFCAGADMQGLQATSRGERGSGAGNTFEDAQAGAIEEMGAENFGVTFNYLMAVRKPIVAAVNGPCAGLGFAIAMLCDIRIASDRAVFTSAFVNRGLIAEHGLSWILPRVAGPSNALDILWTGRKFYGPEAAQMGVVNRSVPHDQVVPEARNYVKALAERSAPMSLKVIKQQVYRHLMMETGDALRESNELMAESLQRDDFKEGVASFVERRPPKFQRITS